MQKDNPDTATLHQILYLLQPIYEQCASTDNSILKELKGFACVVDFPSPCISYIIRSSAHYSTLRKYFGTSNRQPMESLKSIETGIFSMMSKLRDRVAVVIGGGRGLGRSVALAFARENAITVVAARTESEIEETANQIRKIGKKALAIRVDASVKQQVVELVSKVSKSFRTIDILVNCQGEPLIKPTLDTTEKDWNNVIDNNLKSVYLTCQAIIPKMIDQGGGHIINISSRAGLWYPGGGELTLYKAAKMGVIGFSKALSDEVKKHNIKVSVICPGPMDTPMRWRATPNFDRAKVISPDKVADLIVLIASWQDAYAEEVIVPLSVNC